MGELTCPDDCTNPSQGICNGFDGTCLCMPGFGGDDCSGNDSFTINLIHLMNKHSFNRPFSKDPKRKMYEL